MNEWVRRLETEGLEPPPRRRQQHEPLYFVYVLLDGDVPFYVGSSNTISGDRRLREHVRDGENTYAGKVASKNRKRQIIRRMLAEGRTLQWRKIAEGLTCDQARELERETIMRLHIRNGGTVVNMITTAETTMLRKRIAELEEENQRLRQQLTKGASHAD